MKIKHAVSKKIEQRRLQCGPFEFVNHADDQEVWAIHGKSTMTTDEINAMAAANKWPAPKVVMRWANLV